MSYSYITPSLLTDLGIHLPSGDAESLIAHLNETVEERIGLEIAESLSDEELAEMITLQETASSAELAAWITAHVDQSKYIIQDNIDIVLGELAGGVEIVNQSVAS